MYARGIQRGFAALAAIGLLVLGTIAVDTPTVASADVPPTQEVAEEFIAPACDGSTASDPTQASGPVSNLRLVFGDRLAAYNRGEVVPLYDAYGNNDFAVPGGGYPPVCGVRYDQSSGKAVSEWMFCTDIWSKVCSGVNVDGTLSKHGGTELDGLSELSGNAKLTTEAERLILALINGSWDYQGVGYYNNFGATTARADGTSGQRAALQVLVWCVTDPPAAEATESEGNRYQTCQQSLPSSMQQQILAEVPISPELTVSRNAQQVTDGERAVFTIHTNVLNRAIELTLTGPATGLTVTSGAATLDGDTLTVTGDGEITLETATTGAGVVGLEAVTEALSTENLAWHQARTTSGVVDTDCQVFSTMFAEPVTLQGDAAVTIAATVASPSATPSATDTAPGGDVVVTNADEESLAQTGGMPVAGIAVGLLLTALGAGIVVTSRRARGAADRR